MRRWTNISANNVYRDDIGAYNLDGSVVEFGSLRSIFVCDTVIGLDVKLA